MHFFIEAELGHFDWHRKENGSHRHTDLWAKQIKSVKTAIFQNFEQAVRPIYTYIRFFTYLLQASSPVSLISMYSYFKKWRIKTSFHEASQQIHSVGWSRPSSGLRAAPGSIPWPQPAVPAGAAISSFPQLRRSPQRWWSHWPVSHYGSNELG